MKYIITILIVTIFNNLGKSQLVVVNKEKMLFDSLTIHELKDKGVLSDLVYRDNRVIFLEYINNNEKRQYFRLSDTTYTYRSFYRGSSYETGQFLLANIDNGDIDTSLTFCYPEEIIFTRKFHLLRHGVWNKENPSGARFKGAYKEGKKEGIWKIRDFRNLRLEKEYENGILIRQTHPHSYEVSEFLKTYKDKSMVAIINDDTSKIDTIEIKLDSIDTLKHKHKSKYFIDFISSTDIKVMPYNVDELKDKKSIEIKWRYWPKKFNIKIDNLKNTYKVQSAGRDGLVLIKEEEEKKR